MSVKPNGDICKSSANLLSLADSFGRTMRRYHVPMQKFESYTLEEAINLLKGRQSAFENSIDRIVLEQKVKSQEREIAELVNVKLHQEMLIKSYTKALARAVVREYAEDVQKAIDRADAARSNMSSTENKGAANRPIAMIFRSFAKREGVVLSAPSRSFLLEELSRQKKPTNKRG